MKLQHCSTFRIGEGKRNGSQNSNLYIMKVSGQSKGCNEKGGILLEQIGEFVLCLFVSWWKQIPVLLQQLQAVVQE